MDQHVVGANNHSPSSSFPGSSLGTSSSCGSGHLLRPDARKARIKEARLGPGGPGRPGQRPGVNLVSYELPVDKWFDYLSDPTLADAILDRLIHNAHRIPLRGDSMRKHKEALTCTENSN
jgi:hypothetical protein